MKSRNKYVFLVYFVFLLLRPAVAYAYLDPGSGSYVFQIILAGLLAGSFFIKTIWQKAISFFRSFFKGKKDV